MIKKNELFIFSSGEYSDYEVFTVCRALKNIDVDKMKDEYLKLYSLEDYGFSEYRFMNWIINVKHLVEELDFKEWFLGTFNNCDSMNLKKWDRSYRQDPGWRIK